MQNYCFDVCQFNSIERRFWTDKNEKGVNITHSVAVGPTNKKIQCTIGYKQVVSSTEALANSLVNGAEICRLQHIFYKR